jgi:ABC-type transport system involved in cytochrome c biogenesis permease subunit
VPGAYDLLGLPQPHRGVALVTVAAGVALAGAAAALLRSRTPRAVLAAAMADLAGALGLVCRLILDDPATRARGTAVLAIVAAGLVLQAAFDALALRQTGPPVDHGSDRSSER